jgi:hypothetical protein
MTDVEQKCTCAECRWWVTKCRACMQFLLRQLGHEVWNENRSIAVSFRLRTCVKQKRTLVAWFNECICHCQAERDDGIKPEQCAAIRTNRSLFTINVWRYWSFLTSVAIDPACLDLVHVSGTNGWYNNNRARLHRLNGPLSTAEPELVKCRSNWRDQTKQVLNKMSFLLHKMRLISLLVYCELYKTCNSYDRHVCNLWLQTLTSMFVAFGGNWRRLSEGS